MQKTEANWDAYYRLTVSRLGNNIGDFNLLLHNLNGQSSGLFDSPEGMNFVLGGFASHNGTPGDFKQFIYNFRYEHEARFQDRLIFLDMNKRPLDGVDTKQAVRAKLEHPPFKSDSLDLIVLSGTADFMEDSAVSDFSRNAALVLKKNGIVLASTTPKKAKPYLESMYPVPVYFRDIDGLVSLMEPLKLVGYRTGSRPFGTYSTPHFYTENYAFSRSDSTFKQVTV
ncbi:MAG: methyltransferase domain-containing protein [Candidatus Levyibacteriota bacterium]